MDGKQPIDPRLKDLYELLARGAVQESDLAAYFALLQRQGQLDDQLIQLMMETLEQQEISPIDDEERLNASYQAVWATLTNFEKRQHKPKRIRWPFWAGAAAVLFAVLIVSQLGDDDEHPHAISFAELPQVVDRPPGGNKALLTYPDGRTIALSESQSSIVVSQDITYADGTVVDTAQGASADDNEALMVTTPKGGSYRIILSDGTEVSLNAASTLRYPARFSGSKRTVELEGEGYFLVKKDVNRPFSVSCAGQQVQVLGTEFNISAYPDEAVETITLIAGSVRVANTLTKSKTLLSPGQQAVVQSKATEVKDVDPRNAAAWVDGRFSFNSKPFDQVMRELARWYDIEIRYEGQIPDIEFFGGAFRNKNLSLALRMIESAELSYRLEGRILTIQNTGKGT